MDLKKIKTYSAKNRKHKVSLGALAKIGKKNSRFSAFYDNLPDFLAVKEL